MSDYEQPLAQVCEDDGKGGCKKHPPTIRLVMGQWWLLDEECPGRRHQWPAIAHGDDLCEDRQRLRQLALTYLWMIDPRLSTETRIRSLRRVRAAEKARRKTELP